MKTKAIFLVLLTILFVAGKDPQHFYIKSATITDGQIVGTVIASDPDAGQVLKFSILSGNTNTSFKINPKTGVLTINNAAYIKSRTKKYYDLVIKVTDNGSPPLSAQGKIHIIILV